MVKCRFFRKEDFLLWNEFVENSKLNSFLFLRSYMDYHSDRFEDQSLLFFDNDKLIALLPANRKGWELFSHAGLTFGGLILSKKLRSDKVYEVFHVMRDFLLENGISRVIYKAVPYFMCNVPSQEDIYFLNILGAKLIRRDLTSIIYKDQNIKFSKGRRALISKAKKNNVLIEESKDWAAFHNILSEALLKHNTRAIHSVDELKLLHDRHENNIKLYMAYHNNVPVSGALMFYYDAVVHTQYLANSEAGRAIGALDLLINTLIDDFNLSNNDVFSFGISTENNGLYLNQGLLAQKESFGARSAVIDVYSWDLND